MSHTPLTNSVVDNFGQEQKQDKEEEVAVKRGTWFIYDPDFDEYNGPCKTKGDAIEEARQLFSASSLDEEIVWLCQAVQKVIFTRKVHVVESDE